MTKLSKTREEWIAKQAELSKYDGLDISAIDDIVILFAENAELRDAVESYKIVMASLQAQLDDWNFPVKLAKLEQKLIETEEVWKEQVRIQNELLKQRDQTIKKQLENINNLKDILRKAYKKLNDVYYTNLFYSIKYKDLNGD